MDNLNFGIIGNCRTAALVSDKGSIDWCCLPEFDSPSVFGRLLDEEKGGCFSIETDDAYEVKQQYVKNTSILVTTFDNGADAFELWDFMPRYLNEKGISYSPPEINRFLKLKRGTPHFRVKYDPKLGYAADETFSYVKDDFIVSLTRSKKFDSIFLYSSFDFDKIASGSEMVLESDGFFVASYHEKILLPDLEKITLDLYRTKVYWLNWSDKTPTFPQYDAEINRSAITLKLLSYERTGAILAAATTSLPETIGEVRNWDYRFCWIRDASMVVKVLTSLGHYHQAKAYLAFVFNLIPDKDQKLQIMYGINGEKRLTETTLDHLEGYMGSKPVRIGNAAYMQRQHDIHGILMDVIYQQLENFKTEPENREAIWDITKGIVWTVDQHWREPDKGIWEFRTEERHFTFSKVLCWTAIDRAVKTALIFGKKRKAAAWEKLAQEIRADIEKNAWSDSANAYTQSYGREDLDASVLLMENYGFIEANNPRYIATVKAIGEELSYDGLLYRYKNRDDFGLPSSSFTICTFWYLNSLHKIGETKKAKEMFDRLLSFSNHLGLFSEDIDFKTKRMLGNFPQAYSHLALIETAINLSTASEA